MEVGIQVRRIRLLAALVCAGTLVGGIVVAGPAAAAVAPANDTLPAATVVSSLPFHRIVDTTGATTGPADAQANASNPECRNPFAPTLNKTVWYKFTAGTQGGLGVDATASDYAVGILIATGTPGALNVLTCGLGVAGTPTVAGRTYYVNAFDLFGNTGGTLDISFVRPPPAPTLKVAAARGTVDSTGAATISFDYTCTNGVFLDAFIELSQAFGRFTITGLALPSEFATCDGTQQTWSTTIFPENGKFSGGKATILADIEVCGIFQCTVAPLVTQTIQLRRSAN
jgi:hypothetical protein